MARRTADRSRRAANSNTYRFFVQPEAIQGSDVRIEESGLIHQIGNVLRLGRGSQVTLLDNSGWEHTVVLDTVERRAITGSVETRQPAAGEPRLNLVLYVALLKGERFEWVLQKGTELGISVFVPVISERSVVDEAANIGTARFERWARIVREAAEQSRRGKLPELQPPQRFGPSCEQAVHYTRRLFLWEGSGGRGLREVLKPPLAATTDAALPSLALFSGPEGGWTESEHATAIMYNMLPVSLGPRILRAETAPMAAASAIFYEYGDLE